MLHRRSLLAMPVILAAGRVAAESQYPDRPIRLIVPFPPGGGTDNLGRLVAKALGDRLGQTVVVENRGGAGGNIGTAATAQAVPDGYTVLLNGNGMAIADRLFRNPGFNYLKDFAYVARTASTPMLLVVNEHVPVRDLQEFITYAKANPGRLNHGTPGNGTSQHLAAELFNDMAGTNIIHVPYRGTGPSVAGLVSNDVQVMFASVTAVDALIRDGRVRPLANTAAKRARAWPQLPAIAEALPGYAAELWYVLAVPARTPEHIIAVLDNATREVFTDQNFARVLEDRGFDPEYLDGPSVPLALKEEDKRWTPVISRAGITLE
jgi:tripartite-type tricarboxylate transporter receptor subunit TctC